MSTIPKTSIAQIPNILKMSNPQIQQRGVSDAWEMKSNASIATISQAARDLAAHEARFGDVGDFRDMSPNDMLKTVNRLITSGQMTLDESSALILQIPISIKGGDNSSLMNQKIDFISALEQAISYSQFTHNDAAVFYGKKALSALERIQKLS